MRTILVSYFADGNMYGHLELGVNPPVSVEQIIKLVKRHSKPRPKNIVILAISDITHLVEGGGQNEEVGGKLKT